MLTTEAFVSANVLLLSIHHFPSILSTTSNTTPYPNLEKKIFFSISKDYGIWLFP